MSTPTELDTCELCGQQLPQLCTLAFRRGKVRRACILCLAEAMQGATGWKMVKMVARMVEATVSAPEVSRLRRAIAAQARGEDGAGGE